LNEESIAAAFEDQFTCATKLAVPEPVFDAQLEKAPTPVTLLMTDQNLLPLHLNRTK
jgi:hypothetical protein